MWLGSAKKIDQDGYALWIEEKYCSPPLDLEREVFLIDILMILQSNY
jgi:hypothetical protein